MSTEKLYELRQRLRNRDIPDCKCPAVWVACVCLICRGRGERDRPHPDRLARCGHIKRKRLTRYTLAQWAAALRIAWPWPWERPQPDTFETPERFKKRLKAWLLACAYSGAEPPAPWMQARVKRVRAAVAVMARRYRAGVGLRHPLDSWRCGRLTLKVAVVSDGHAANGIGQVGERLVVETERKPGPVKWPYAQEGPPPEKEAEAQRERREAMGGRRREKETDRQRERRELENRVSALLLLRGANGRGFDALRPLTAAEIESVYGQPEAKVRAA